MLGLVRAVVFTVVNLTALTKTVKRSSEPRLVYVCRNGVYVQSYLFSVDLPTSARCLVRATEDNRTFRVHEKDIIEHYNYLKERVRERRKQ